MDVRLSRSSKTGGRGPHNWHTWDRYRTIHELRLRDHPFVDWSKEQPLGFDDLAESIRLEGRLYCLGAVILEIEKELETRTLGKLRQVRGVSYRYAAWVEGHHPLLRYHNIHRNDDAYHHRIFNWRTGAEVLYETLERHQFPTFSEVLDEVQAAYNAFK